VPTILNSIFLLGKSKKFCKNKIKFIGCGSAILDKKDHVNFEKKFGIKVSNLYGLSETGATHFDNPFLKNRVPGSIGKPLKGVKCKLLINKKISSIKNQSGQILIKSNFLMNGYLGKRKINQNNFFKTGDLGKFDKNNNLIFVDRRKDIIVKGGVNIMPSEIEEVIKEINHIVDVAVIGIKDEFFGENLVGHIVSQKSNPDLKQILQYCEKKLGLFKTPIDLIIHKQLPKTASGKILKRHLK
jgi:long-chain acyl-CoA synthetase